MPTKKVPVKEVKKAKVSKEKKVQVPKSSVKLISYEMSAVIPVMAYGNISPTIKVEAKTVEEAREFVMAHISDLYNKYAEVLPSFLRNVNVTVTEKKVDVEKSALTPPPTQGPKTLAPAQATVNLNQKMPGGVVPAKMSDELNPKSAAFEKAYGAIKNSMSRDSLSIIENQVQNSVKLSDEEKPILLTEVLKKRKELE